MSPDCSSGLHEHCIPCDCGCHHQGLQKELLDLITLMPDSQTQEIINYITELRAIRKRRDDNSSSYIQRT